MNYGVNKNISGKKDTQWHIPFALQLVPGTLLVICMFLQPESPRWLLNANRVPEAREVLQRLRQLPADDQYLNWEIDTVLRQIEEERALSGNKTFMGKLWKIALPSTRLRLILGIALMFKSRTCRA